MSVVAVKKYKDRIEIGADSQTTSGSLSDRRDSGKIGRISNDLVVGHCGKCASFTLLKTFAKTNKLQKSNEDSVIEFFTKFFHFVKTKYIKPEEYEIHDSSFIIVHKKKIFYVIGYYIREIKDFYAAGSGRTFALTALELGASLRDSIKVACKYDIYCGLPVKLITIKK